MRYLSILLIGLLLQGCSVGELACPRPQRVHLKKRAGVNYKVLMARRRNEPKKITKAELRQLQSHEFKTVSVEEWDCPRPGSGKMPKQVQNNIRKNKKKFESYYKNRNLTDSIQSITQIRE